MKKIPILKLKPTQMAIGFLEVENRLKELHKLKKKKLRKQIANCVISVVVNPQGEFYIVDGHHHVFAYWLIGVTSVPVKIKYRFSKSTTYEEFWKKMKKEKWVHPYNESGDGPIDFIYLSHDIRGVGNDPYRSLAWMVRQNGGYKKTNLTFADFQWAQIFRKLKLLHCHYNPRFTEVLPKALKIAGSKKCSKLPGYIK